MKKESKILAAVTGQPNSGKSTIFNLLTGARQHVANFPGITVEKKTGAYKSKDRRIELVDLPGTYSLTSYSLEERVSRDFLLHEKPDVVLDVADASNLERSLYLIFQLAEMGLPLVLALNMMDVAKRRGFEIDIERLSKEIGMPVVATIGNKGKGKSELRQAIHSAATDRKDLAPIRLDYGKTLGPILSRLEEDLKEDQGIKDSHHSSRWLAVKLMENDIEAQRLVREHSKDADTILSKVAQQRKEFISENKNTPEKVIAQSRYQAAEEITGRCLVRERAEGRNLTDRIDGIVCNRFFGPVFLIATIYFLYELAIVRGYKITDYTWPLLAWFRGLIASILPGEGFVFDPLLRGLPLGVIDGVAAVLNYVPIFMILFALIAILEDTGYMTRMAFILDRIFRHFGLHGQSILPLVLGGLYVGGCAIPGCMACRGIKDERARLATILIVPLMNCLAKIPLYLLLIGIFFAAHKGFAMFFMATITIIIALSVSKVLSMTVLKKKETAPFILEMPAYHLPTIQGVLRRCLERTWLFVRKIITIVVAVMAIVYLLVTFPGLDREKKAYYDSRTSQARQSFFSDIGEENPYTKVLAGPGLMEFARYENDYKTAKMGVEQEGEKKAVDQRFLRENPEFFKIANKGKVEIDGIEGFEKYLAGYKEDRERFLATWHRLSSKGDRNRLKEAFYQKWQNITPDFFGLVRTGEVMVKGGKIIDENAKKVSTAHKKLEGTRKGLRRERKEEVIMASYLGRLGLFMEPVTKFAGFNWRVNIALLSSFAAKESSVATLGSIYEPSPGGEERLEERITEKEKGWTPLHALAIMLFMALYPPCIPTLLMVRLETGSTKWMLFATLYPILLGTIIAILVFSGGSLLGLSGMQAMIAFYVLAIAVMVGMGFIKRDQGSGIRDQ